MTSLVRKKTVLSLIRKKTVGSLVRENDHHISHRE